MAMIAVGICVLTKNPANLKLFFDPAWHSRHPEQSKGLNVMNVVSPN